MDATLHFASGLDISFSSSWCVPGRPISLTWLELEGDNGYLTVNNDGIEIELHAASGPWPAGRTSLGEADLPAPASFHLNGEAYWLEDAHFLRWATGGAEPPITAERAFSPATRYERCAEAA